MAAIGVAVVLAAARLGPGMRNIPAKLALWTALPALLWVTRLISAEEKAIAREGLRWAWQQWRKLRPRGSAETAAPDLERRFSRNTASRKMFSRRHSIRLDRIISRKAP